MGKPSGICELLSRLPHPSHCAGKLNFGPLPAMKLSIKLIGNSHSTQYAPATKGDVYLKHKVA